jgi:peroxiredoxin
MSSRVEINSPAPDFALEDLDGRMVHLSDFRGKNVVLVFNRGFV